MLFEILIGYIVEIVDIYLVYVVCFRVEWKLLLLESCGYVSEWCMLYFDWVWKFNYVIVIINEVVDEW